MSTKDTKVTKTFVSFVDKNPCGKTFVPFVSFVDKNKPFGDSLRHEVHLTLVAPEVEAEAAAIAETEM